MTFVLILLTYYSSGAPSTMSGVPGFKTADDCEAAGKIVLKAAQKSAEWNSQPRYVCVKQ